MSYSLHNQLHGLGAWFSGGGWIVLLVVAAILCLALGLVYRRTR